MVTLSGVTLSGVTLSGVTLSGGAFSFWLNLLKVRYIKGLRHVASLVEMPEKLQENGIF